MSRGAGRGDAWSRRKARVAEAEAREARLAQVAAAEAAAADKTDAELCAELNLPDPDSLAPGDDFAAFLKREVPERLRRRALRKLWRTNPALANVDGLVEYGEDFTMPESAAGAVVATAYRVGRGLLTPDAEAAPVAATEPGAEPEAGSTPAPETEPETEIETAGAAPEPAPPAARAPRRMRFVFDDAPADRTPDQNREPA